MHDLLALRAIEAAEASFNKQLAESFKPAFDQVSGLGYPGITDPRPIVATRLRPVDGLKHQSAVTFEIDVVKSSGELVPVIRLPENNNGIGYQNLISMIFRLMSYRDAWMRVGKASKGPDAAQFEPLHLVSVEEPDAHLNAQVQQVFIESQAGEVLLIGELVQVWRGNATVPLWITVFSTLTRTRRHSFMYRFGAGSSALQPN